MPESFYLYSANICLLGIYSVPDIVLMLPLWELTYPHHHSMRQMLFYSQFTDLETKA